MRDVFNPLWFGTLIILFPNIALLAADDDTYIIETSVGKYRFIELTGVNGKFQLSSDRSLVAVMEQSGLVVYPLVTSNRICDQKPVAKSEIHSDGNWHIVGDELIVAGKNAWTVYKFPQLDQEREVPFPGESAGDCIRLPGGGWRVNEYVMDDSLSSIISTSRSLQDTQWMDMRRKHGGSDPAPLPFDIRLTSSSIHFERYDWIPLSLSLTKDPQRLDQRWLSAGANWFTFAAANQNGIYVEFIDHDFRNTMPYSKGCIVQAQPTLLLSSPERWRFKLVGNKAEVECKLRINASIDANGILDADSIEWSSEFRKHSTRLTEIRELIASYRNSADKEFAAVMNRPPDGIPICIEVVATYLADRFPFVVWVELPEAEFLNIWAPQVIETETKRELERIQSERARELKKRAEMVKLKEKQNLALIGAEQRKLNATATRNYQLLSTVAIFVIGCIAGGMTLVLTKFVLT